jgi:hypothetical protein
MPARKVNSAFAGFNKNTNTPEKVKARRIAADKKHKLILQQAAIKKQLAIQNLSKLTK